jgi:predicted ribosome quality control (RQC) complex YloA/Tae2 family protein
LKSAGTHDIVPGMTLSTVEIAAVVADLAPRLEGGRIERIDQPRDDSIVLNIRNGAERYWLLVCASPRFCRVHLLTRRPREGKPVGGFGNLLRAHLTSAPLVSMRQIGEDRIVEFVAVERDQLHRPTEIRLIAELTGAGANLVLVGSEGNILGALRRGRGARRLPAGSPYTPPPPPPASSSAHRANRFAAQIGDDAAFGLSRAIQSHYDPLETADAEKQLRARLRSTIDRAMKRLTRRQDKIETELEAGRSAESIRRRADLLQIALPDIQPRQSEITVADLYDPPVNPPVTIDLDPTLSPQENVDRLFRRYKKAKAGVERLSRRAAETHAELVVARDLAEALDAADSPAELDTVAERVREAGLLPTAGKARPRPESPTGPRVFHSADGSEILVARSRKENDRLTFSIARGNDSWLHLLGRPGPHVIVRKPRDRDVPDEALLDAAHLAVYFSKLRGTDFAEVACTQVKLVRKPKRAAPGKVSYASARTLAVRIETARLERLLKPVK